MSCQLSGSALRGSTMYVFSTPKAQTLRITVPMFRMSCGSSMTAMRFLQRYALIASARCRLLLFTGDEGATDTTLVPWVTEDASPETLRRSPAFVTQDAGQAPSVRRARQMDARRA